MLKWLRQVMGASAAPQPDAGRVEDKATVGPRPPPGRKWIYLAATDCDVASAVRTVDGILKVTREKGYWRVTADKDVVAQVAKVITSRGGTLSMLITSESLSEFAPR